MILNWNGRRGVIGYRLRRVTLVGLGTICYTILKQEEQYET